MAIEPAAPSVLTRLASCACTLVFGLSLIASAGHARAETGSSLQITFPDPLLGKGRLVASLGIVKAGPVEIVIYNSSSQITHNLLLAQVTDGADRLRMSAAGNAVDTDAPNLKYLAKFAAIKPGESVRLRYDLWAGRYVIFCSKPKHYEAEGDIFFDVVN